MEGSRSSEQNRNDGQEEEINLFLKVRKTVAVSVKKSGTVRNVKEVLKSKEGISECIQDLFYSGDWLRDDRKLVDCSIQPNSTLDVLVQNYEPLKLFVKGPSHQEPILIEARSRDTIQNVKSTIMAAEGMHYSCDIGLIFAGKLLADDRTLASLSIQGGSTLHMMIMPKDTFTISVKMPKGEILKVEVKLFYTIRAIKTVVESLVDISIDDLGFVYNGVHLDYSKNLSCYNITEESILDMVPQSFQVFVRDHFSGKTVIVDVHHDDLVKDLKTKLLAKLLLPTKVQKLKFEGAYLKDDRNITSYNISKDSTLQLHVYKSSSNAALIKSKKVVYVQVNDRLFEVAS